MDDEYWKRLFELDHKQKVEFLKNNPNVDGDGEFWDSHCCSTFADALGYCQFCGAIVSGSYADHEEHGY